MSYKTQPDNEALLFSCCRYQSCFGSQEAWKLHHFQYVQFLGLTLILMTWESWFCHRERCVRVKMRPRHRNRSKWGHLNITAHSGNFIHCKGVQGCDSPTVQGQSRPRTSPMFTSTPETVTALLGWISRLRTKRSLWLMNSSPVSAQLLLSCVNNHWVLCTQWEYLCQQKKI